MRELRTSAPLTKTEAAATDTRFSASSLVLAFRHALAVNRPLTLLGLAMIPLAFASLIGVFLDPQIITGAPAWAKPLKFAISTAIYSFTILYLLTFVTGHRRLVWLIGGISAVGLAVELTLIPLQVVRGTTSHFNFSTPFDATVFEIMGGAIVLVFVMGLALAVLLLRQKLPDSSWVWAMRLGLIGVLVGMAAATLMLAPTPEQLAAARLTDTMPVIGAHTVGAADGGPGLPFLGWSTVHGDLRVPHFFGLHTLQMMLVIGWFVGKLRLSGAQRRGIVITCGLGLIGGTLLLTWQALRGQSVIAPDGMTVVAAVALLVAVASGIALSLFRGRADGSPSLRTANG